MEVPHPTAGPTEALKKEGILCKSSWEVYCSLVVRLQDTSVKGWPLCRDLVPLQWRLSQSWCPFSLSSFLPEFLASKDVGLAGCLAAKCPWSSLGHGTIGWFWPEGTSGGPYPTSCSDIKPACLVLYMGCREFPCIIQGLLLSCAGLWHPVFPWVFRSEPVWPSEFPAFQATENTEAVLWN